MAEPSIHFMTLNEIVLATEHSRKHYRDRKFTIISTDVDEKQYGVLSVNDLGDEGVGMIIAERALLETYLPDVATVWEKFSEWETQLARQGTGLSDEQKVGAFIAFRWLHDEKAQT